MESFKKLSSKVDVLSKDKEGKLKGGFASAISVSVETSAVLGNNCKCKNYNTFRYRELIMVL